MLYKRIQVSSLFPGHSDGFSGPEDESRWGGGRSSSLRFCVSTVWNLARCEAPGTVIIDRLPVPGELRSSNGPLVIFRRPGDPLMTK